MNNVNLIGLVYTPLKVTITQDERRVIDFNLMSVSTQDNNESTVKIRCLFDEVLSSKINPEFYRVGSLVCISGELRSYTPKDRDENTEFQNYVLVSFIELLKRREVKMTFDFDKFMNQFDLTKMNNMRKNLAREMREANKEKEDK